LSIFRIGVLAGDVAVLILPGEEFIAALLGKIQQFVELGSSAELYKQWLGLQGG
jgi:hypothetical protein